MTDTATCEKKRDSFIQYTGEFVRLYERERILYTMQDTGRTSNVTDFCIIPICLDAV